MQEKMSGEIFNIQRYSIHDGPGVRTTVFLKGCPLRCYWCQNPESQALTRKLLYNYDLCTGCGICIRTCPSDAVFRDDTGDIRTRRDICSVCGTCADACPTKARTIAGRTVTVDEVMREVLSDRKVYMNSGGGMTLSGGEVTMQSGFALALLKAAKENWIHTTIETCGYTSWETLEQLLEYTDVVLYDLKCMDPEKHREGTGVDSGRILENARRVAAMRPVKFRTPLIPGFNDTPENVVATALFIKDELGGKQGCYELLRYNRMGEVKFERLDRKDEQPHMIPQSDEYFAELQALAESVWEES